MRFPGRFRASAAVVPPALVIAALALACLVAFVAFRSRGPSAAFADIAKATKAAEFDDPRKGGEEAQRVLDQGAACAWRLCSVEAGGISLDYARGRYSVDLLPVEGYSTSPRRVATESGGVIYVGDSEAFGYVATMEKDMSFRSLQTGR